MSSLVTYALCATLVVAAAGHLHELGTPRAKAGAGANQASTSTVSESIAQDFVDLLSHDAVSLLSETSRHLSNQGLDLQMTNPAALLRVTEELRMLKVQGASVTAPEGLQHDRSLVLATDLAYVASLPAKRDVTVQRQQFQELMAIAHAGLDQLIAENQVDTETEARVRDSFAEITSVSLSYFDQPRLAALAIPRSREDLARMKLEMGKAAASGVHDYMATMKNESAARSHPDPQRFRESQRSVALRHGADYLAVRAFQVYVLNDADLDSPDHPLSRIKQVRGLFVGDSSYEQRHAFSIRYLYAQ